MCVRLPLLPPERREIPCRRRSKNQRHTELCSLSASGAGIGDHAVELSILAGVSLCGAGLNARERGPPETRIQRPATRLDNPTNFSQRTLPRGGVSDAAERFSPHWHTESES